MYKFLLGLALGLAVGGVYFHYQVKKVDIYSNHVAYILGRIDEHDNPDPATPMIACHVYYNFKIDAPPPFGYTTTYRDADLKEFCQNISKQSQSQEQ